LYSALRENTANALYTQIQAALLTHKLASIQHLTSN